MDMSFPYMIRRNANSYGLVLFFLALRVAWRCASGYTIYDNKKNEKKQPYILFFTMNRKNMYVPAHGKAAHSAPLSALIGLAAGLLNGLFGTGGGMVLALGLGRIYPRDRAENMAISTASVLVFSILTTILYGIQGHIELSDVLPILLPALLGGTLGSLLLGRLSRGVIDLILALMLLWSGVMLLL
jgi:uncharacterized membrane protein YfcA